MSPAPKPAEPVTAAAEITIARSAQAVWELLRDQRNLPKVAAHVVRVEPVAGTGPGVGRQVSVLTEQGTTRRMVVYEVVAEEPARWFEVRTLGPSRVHQRYAITHTGHGCVLRCEASLLPTSPLEADQPGELARLLEGELTEELQAWARLAEAEALGEPRS